MVLLTGCIRTEGTLELKGKTIDEKTRVLIPGKEIIIQAQVKSDNGPVFVYAGQTSTDSSGYFTYSLKKVKDVHYYNFCFVGDSDYAYETRLLGLWEMKENAQFLTFPLRKLVELTIKISRTSKTPLYDTLFLLMESDGIDGRILYPYRIDNFKEKPAWELCWIGGNVESTIKTRAFADKRTKVYWELLRNGKKKELTDTITCRRNMTNSILFRY